MKFFNFGKPKNPVPSERMEKALSGSESREGGDEIQHLVSPEQFSKIKSLKDNIALNGGVTTHDDRRLLDELCSELDPETERVVRSYVVTQ